MHKSLCTIGAILVISCSLAIVACQPKSSAVELRKAEIREKDSLELQNARQELRVADSLVAFKTFELEDLREQFVFEKQERYQTVGYYVLPFYKGGKERFTFFPEVEEGGKLLLVSIDGKRKYTFTEVELADDYATRLPKSLSDAQRKDVAMCYILAKAMCDLSEAQKQQEKMQLKVQFYEKKKARKER